MKLSIHGLFVAVCACAWAPLSAGADEVCDAVLQHQAFNIYDSTTKTDLDNSELEEMCKLNWKVNSATETQSQDIGGGGSYNEIYKGWVNTAKSRGVSSTEITKDNLCTKRDQRLVSAFYTTMHAQSADRAVEAWERCVLNTGTAGLRSAVVRTPGTNDFDIRVHYRPAGGTDKLVIKGYDHDKGFRCNLDGTDVVEFAPTDHGYSERFILSCRKITDENISVAINTNSATNTIGPYTLVSDQYSDLISRVQRLEGELAATKGELDELKSSRLPFGGFYAETDDKSGRTTNPYTNLTNCPKGFRPTKLTRALWDNVPGKGVDVWMCTADR